MRYKKKPKPKPDNITIVYDDRENKPWLFLAKRWLMKRKRLKVGDYTIAGYEDKIAIEKKSGVQELFADLTGKERARYERFLQKLSKYPVKAIVVEDPFIKNHIYSLAKRLQCQSPTRLSASTIFYWTAKTIAKYGIPIIFIDRASREELVVTLIEQCREKVENL